MALNGDNLAAAVTAAIAALSDADKGDLVKVKKAEWNAVVTYIVANLEIKGVTTVLQTGTPMTAGGYPVLDVVVPMSSAATQNNDGTGHVA
jgi:hypothetical protein